VKVSVLMYHDVVGRGDADASGFRGAAAARYKVERETFGRQLDAALAATGRPPMTLDALAWGGLRDGAWCLTFDDGGASAIEIGEALTRRGWCGTFFVPTAFVGRPGFAGPDDLRALHRMGHVLGAHSHSHPAQISALDPPALAEEWQRNTGELAALIGAPVTIASVPGGFYSRAVGRAAAAAGIRVLCTSEPVRGLGRIDDCRLVGRYGVLAGTSSAQVAAIAAGARLPWLRERASWELRKAAKLVGGRRYIQLREALLERRQRVAR
jgi:peptidoglycan/xylan/chitin deacetylase (PgdA/CDA1 family)